MHTAKSILPTLVACLAIGCGERQQRRVEANATEEVTTNVGFPVITTVQAMSVVLEAHLIWASFGDTRPESGYKPVDPDVRSVLKRLPFRWTDYFVVDHTRFSGPFKKLQQRTLGDGCQLTISTVSNTTFQVDVLFQGHKAVRRFVRLAKGEPLMVGGDTTNSSGPFVLVRRIQ
jgi:hypothetical protein